MLSVCLCVCMYEYVPEQFDELYVYSVFKSSFVIGRCLVNMYILAPKIDVYQMGPKNKMAIFSKWLERFSLNFSMLLETIALNKTP
jgi:hypothetical protein